MSEYKSHHPATRNVREYLSTRSKNQQPMTQKVEKTAQRRPAKAEPNIDDFSLVRGAKYVWHKYVKFKNFIKYVSNGNLITVMNGYKEKLARKFYNYGPPSVIIGTMYFTALGVFSWDTHQNYLHVVFNVVPLPVQAVIYYIMHPFILYVATSLLVILFEFLYLVRRGMAFIYDHY